MSIRAIDLVWKRSKAKGSELLLMLAIADYAQDDGTGAWPSQGKLAQKARLSRQRVNMKLTALEKMGELIIHRGEGKNGVNIYDIHLPVEDEVVTPSLQPPVTPSLQPPVTPSLQNPSLNPSINHHAPSPKNGDGKVAISSELPDAKTQEAILFAGRANTVKQAEDEIKAASWRIQPDEVRWVVAQFMAASGLPVPYDKVARKRWVAGAKEHLETFGMDFLKKHYPKAVTDLRRRTIIVAQPQALTKYLSDLKAQGRPPANVIVENGKRVRVVK